MLTGAARGARDKYEVWQDVGSFLEILFHLCKENFDASTDALKIILNSHLYIHDDIMNS